MSMPAFTAERPAHVPPDLYWDANLDTFVNELPDPFLAAARLHDGPDIIYARAAALGMPGWILTRHAHMSEAFLDHEHFGNMVGDGSGASQMRQRAMEQGMIPQDSVFAQFRLLPLMVDPPQHGPYRILLNPFFIPRAINQLDASVRAICDDMIAPFANADGCEFIEDFSTHFPTRVFLALLGLPQDNAKQFLAWEHGLMRGDDFAARAQAMMGMIGYLKGFLDQQRADPKTELMAGIVAGQIEGRPVTDAEILGMLALLYIGGLDTVHSALGWFMRHLARDQALQQRLRQNPDEIPRAVEELMRCYGITATHRRVAQDFNFHGVEMHKGDMVLLPAPLAARDPRAYENPHVVDIDRNARHIFFGFGAHHCLGQHLARREIKIVFESFLSRFNNIRIPEGAEVKHHTGSTWGVDKLPLIWDRL